MGVAPHYNVWVNSQSKMTMFCLKKLITQPRGVQNPPLLIQMMLTHYTLRSVLFRPHQTPVFTKNAKMCYFQHFLGVPKKTYTLSSGLP